MLQVQPFITVHTTSARGDTNARGGGHKYTRRSENWLFDPSEFTLGDFFLFLANIGTARLAMTPFLTHFNKDKWEKSRY